MKWCTVCFYKRDHFLSTRNVLGNSQRAVTQWVLGENSETKGGRLWCLLGALLMWYLPLLCLFLWRKVLVAKWRFEGSSSRVKRKKFMYNVGGGTVFSLSNVFCLCYR